MLEIEQKFARADFPDLVAKLAALGADVPQTHVEEDHYFNAPDRDFARTGEAFRLRRVGQANLLTYKGPKKPGPVKVRAELEIALPDGEGAAREHQALLVHLGYRPVAVVRKTRQSYPLEWRGRSFTVCLDDAEGLGRFAEVETLADADASAEVAALAAELGLVHHEPRSYLGMVLEKPSPRETAVVRTCADLQAAMREARRQGRSVGFVPTMGALHAGHASLVAAARRNCEFVVVSVFVNPSQFGPAEDLSRYPRPFDADLALCRAEGADLVFNPPVEEVYPPGFRTWCRVEGLEDVLEGASRPGHFRGVATVVLKLLNLVGPCRLYLGEKDAQQLLVLRTMIRDVAVPAEVVPCPTVREQDGLALSSRNVYLDPAQREGAVVLSRALDAARAAFAAGERSAARLRSAMEAVIGAEAGASI
ncbi:MAG: pantoate--beta-alanine ligase, partial [Gemmataceae bacterium]|nr:pantoate--beta-alanine ligase [Gemmataceae bacterium]